MNSITPMQANRFGKRANRIDSVKTITVQEFKESGLFEETKSFTSVDGTLKFDEERGGVFVWSNMCNQYFLVGKKK